MSGRTVVNKTKKVTSSEEKTEENRPGNTRSGPVSKARGWFFTLNNPEKNGYSNYMELINILNAENVDRLVFQLEEGENKTPHYQGALYFKYPVSFNSVKNLDGSIHWEHCKNWKEAIKYCTKKEGRLAGPWSINVPLPNKKAEQKPRDWQIDVVKLLDEEPDERSIIWIYDPLGNNGKSWLTKWLYMNRQALFTQGKMADIAHQLTKESNPRIVMFDIPRTNIDYISYPAIESIKNGIVFSGKYDSKCICFETPHVIVFCNELPKWKAMTMDRWKVFTINDNKLVEFTPPNAERYSAKTYPRFALLNNDN